MEPIAHGYDWAWAQISGQDVQSNGGSFVVRYLGGNASLTDIEATNLHADGVPILLVMEQEATLAEGGFNRGLSAAAAANAQADQLGYPNDCVIFYADDNNDAETASEVEFMRGVLSVGGRPAGLYSGGNVLAAVKAEFPQVYTWRVETWFPQDFPEPDLEQLANTRAPEMVGVDPATYDTNLMYRAIPMWGPQGTIHGDDDMTPDDLFAPTAYGVSRFEVAFKAAAEKYVLPTLAQWEQDTRNYVSKWLGQLQDHIDAALAALPTSGGSVDAAAVRTVVADVINNTHFEVK